MEIVRVLHRVPDDDEVFVHVHRGHVVAAVDPLMAHGRTVAEALARLEQARQLYRLLLVRPDSPAARRLASTINDLYTT